MTAADAAAAATAAMDRALGVRAPAIALGHGQDQAAATAANFEIERQASVERALERLSSKMVTVGLRKYHRDYEALAMALDAYGVENDSEWEVCETLKKPGQLRGRILYMDLYQVDYFGTGLAAGWEIYATTVCKCEYKTKCRGCVVCVVGACKMAPTPSDGSRKSRKVRTLCAEWPPLKQVHSARSLQVARYQEPLVGAGYDPRQLNLYGNQTLNVYVTQNMPRYPPPAYAAQGYPLPTREWNGSEWCSPPMNAAEWHLPDPHGFYSPQDHLSQQANRAWPAAATEAATTGRCASANDKTGSWRGGLQFNINGGNLKNFNFTA